MEREPGTWNLAPGTSWGLAAAYWGLSGFILLILQALVRFYPIVGETVLGASSPREVITLSASVLLFGVGKGYYLLHRRFAPKFARRVTELAATRTQSLHRILAPLYCLQLVGAQKSELIRGYGLTFAIVLMIVGAKRLPDSLYGPVIVGVALALLIGAVTTGVQSVKALHASSAGPNSIESRANTNIRSF
ncbi:MAG TPA: hypothetical protein VMO47_12100 [Rhodothermales bacterium]|nr:hypothetical protein [Rhodothermales bacterium]